MIGLGWLIYKREAMGMGDAKLLAAFGAWFGALPAIPAILIVGSVVGSLIGVSAALATRSSLKLAIPFGPFLGFGAIVWLFFGDNLVIRWAHLFG